MSSYELILLRHGESEWNAKNLFTGWVDVRLSAKGEDEARRGGALLAERGLLPDLLHTSLLRRFLFKALQSQTALNPPLGFATIIIGAPNGEVLGVMCPFLSISSTNCLQISNSAGLILLLVL